MIRISFVAVFLVILLRDVNSAKCRGKYYEMRGGDGFVAQRGCRGLDSQIQEEYWTTIGYDGLLRDGRTTDDFLVIPEQGNGNSLRNSFVGYWEGPETADEITRSKYGESRHYEAFGHAFIKPDGRVCGWFVGMEQEVVEVCGGFRVLSRSRRVPHEPIPFEWVQGSQYRNRDTLGFHHHKIAKYELNTDETFYGDADISRTKFQGVSPVSETFVQVNSSDVFHRKVWLLKKISVIPSLDTRPSKIHTTVRDQEKTVNVYSDPHHEKRISNFLASDQIKNFVNNAEKFSTSSENTDGSQVKNWNRYENLSQGDENYETWLRNEYRRRGIEPLRSPHVSQTRVEYSLPINALSSVEDSGQKIIDSGKSITFGEKKEFSKKHKMHDEQETQHVRLVRYRPRTVIRDRKGNMYEQHIINGKMFFYSIPANNGDPKQIEINDIDPKIEQVLDDRRRKINGSIRI